jgi:hypothetical protein
MKSNFLNIVLFSIILLSCKKNESIEPESLLEDNGCIERIIIPVNAHSIREVDIASSNILFLKKNIDNSRFRYYQYSDDSLQTQFPPYAKVNYKKIRVEEYTNGLRILTGDLIFSFKNEVFNSLSGTQSKGTNLDTKPKLTLGQLRRLFLESAEKFNRRPIIYKDSCFKAEFGYYNIGSDNKSENLTRAWKVTTKNSISPYEYPVAYYQDNDGKLIYYDDGFIVFVK